MIKKCIGCGEQFESDKEICERCFRLINYGEYKKVTKDNTDYLNILDSITNNDLVIYITSLIDLNLDYIDKFKNVVIVLTKRDLLPKSVNDNKLINYVKYNYKFLDIEVISSIKNYNLDSLYNKINKYKKNNIYFVGKTSSGKSTLINKLIKNYSNKENVITTSLYPSTTLNKIEIDLDNFTIIDTPGYISEKSLFNYLSLSKIKNINIKKEIKPKTYQLHGKGSLLIDDFIRIDYDTKLTSATFYFANNITVRKTSKDNTFVNKYIYKLHKQDIVIEELGFIKFTNDIDITIYAKYDIDLQIRDNMI